MAYTPSAVFDTAGSVFDFATFEYGVTTFADGSKVAESRRATDSIVKADGSKVAETRTTALTAVRSLTDVAVIVENAVIGFMMTLTASDKAVVSESRVSTVGKALTDGSKASEARIESITKILSDVVSGADAFSAGLTLGPWTDGVLVAELRAATPTKSLTDGSIVSDVRSQFNWTFTDGIVIVEDYVAGWQFILTASEGVVIADSSSYSNSLPWLSDRVIVVESRIVTGSKALTDGARASETRAVTVGKTLTDRVTAHDTWAEIGWWFYDGSVTSEVKTVDISACWYDITPLVETIAFDLSANFADALSAVDTWFPNAVKWTLLNKHLTTWSTASTGVSAFSRVASHSTTWTKRIDPPVQDPHEGEE